MEGRDFLAVAKRSVCGPTEADWRDAGGRAYYALFLETRDALQRWGFALVRHGQIHAFVRLKFLFSSETDLKTIGRRLEKLGEMRNHADYRLDNPGRFFVNAKPAEQAILNAEDAIALLDQIEADPTRRAAAIASITP